MSFLNRGREKGDEEAEAKSEGDNGGELFRSNERCQFTCIQKAKSQAGYIKRQLGKTRQHIKKQRQHFVDKGPSNQSYGFSSSHVWMSELDCKES